MCNFTNKLTAMSQRQPIIEDRTYTVAEYLALEEAAIEKHEYNRGHITARSGGSMNHSIIGNNINTELNLALRPKGNDCRAMSGDLKIWIDASESFIYPDAMVGCGETEFKDQKQNLLTNPTLIVEVLSDSTEKYDRGAKFQKYRSLLSFREYVLINQYQPVVEVYYRADSSYWKMYTTIGLGGSIYLTSIDCTIQLADIYQNVRDLQEPEVRPTTPPAT